jgi:hypothetical protein
VIFRCWQRGASFARRLARSGDGTGWVGLRVLCVAGGTEKRRRDAGATKIRAWIGDLAGMGRSVLRPYIFWAVLGGREWVRWQLAKFEAGAARSPTVATGWRKFGDFGTYCDTGNLPLSLQLKLDDWARSPTKRGKRLSRRTIVPSSGTIRSTQASLP